MYCCVLFTVTCSWEKPKYWYDFYEAKNTKELSRLSKSNLRKALHYLYKNLEYPIFMNREMSDHLQISVIPVVPMQCANNGVTTISIPEDSRITEVEEALKTHWFNERKEHVNNWRVA